MERKMAVVMFDTHQFIQTLQASGFEQQQAEAVANAFRNAQEQVELATKHDLKELELTLKGEMQALKGEMQSIRAEIQASEYRMTIKLGAMMVVAVGAMATLVKVL
jgi:hypothetical protein